MPKAPSTKRRNGADEGIEFQGGPFDESSPFEEHERDDAPAEAEETEAKGADDAPDTDALMARIARLEEDNSRHRRTTLALMSQPPQVVLPQQQPQDPALDFSGLPDPYGDPDGYKRGVEERTRNFVQQSVQHATRPRQPAQQGVDPAALWEDFTEEFPEYADQQDRIEFVATKVVQKLQRKGVDAQRYVRAASDEFFQEVDKEYKKVFGKKAKRREDADDDEAEERTETLFSGSRKPFARRKSRDDEDDDPGDMLKEIFEIQRKTGFQH